MPAYLYLEVDARNTLRELPRLAVLITVMPHDPTSS